MAISQFDSLYNLFIHKQLTDYSISFSNDGTLASSLRVILIDAIAFTRLDESLTLR
ncbi:hypothetical protein [Tolypothrix sp. VBCCA 56010]|uniref:hypothetical protein n=1 Tax=Tolypothrix sp. VBCCA 56010 TaxID=3137731 RepID=UPI003D7C889B